MSDDLVATLHQAGHDYTDKAADLIKAQAARIAELEAAQGRIILSFRLNLLRLNPRLSHETISKAIEVALTGGKDE
jgi:hypothetical protein